MWKPERPSCAAISRQRSDSTLWVESVGTPSQNLIRMFEPNSDPNAGVLFSVLDHLQKFAGLRLHLAV